LKRKGFTLIELLAVIFIVGIIAAVAIPIMRGRIDSAKWLEGKTGAGRIRTAARTFFAKKGLNWGKGWDQVTLAVLGFNITPEAGGGDLDGRYFTDEAYKFRATGYNTYMITVDANDSLIPDAPSSPKKVTLDQDGVWTEI